MTDLKKTWLSLIVSFSMLCLSHIALSANQIWHGSSGGLNIHWTEADITTSKNGKLVFSAKSDLSKYTNYPVCGYEDKRTLTLLSVVGTIASIKDVSHYHCQNIDGNDPRIIAIDLANSGKPVSLTDFFPESAILKALLADSAIKKVLSNLATPPTTLKALFQTLDDELTNKAITAPDGYGNECQFSIETKYFLTQFAFHHINRDQVAVRLALTPATQQCQWTLAQIGIYLPIPTALQVALKQAQKGKAGFLMGKLQQIAKGRDTIWNYSEPDDTNRDSDDTITVQRGDTLYSIARHYGHSVADIAAWNELTRPYQLSPGQSLLVTPPASKEEEKVEEEKPLYHTVALGETLYRIARHYGQRVADIAAWNKLQKPYTLSAGQKLQVSEPTPKWTWTQKGIVHSTLPEFTFKLTGEGTVQAIEIRRGNQSEPVQIISLSDEGPPAFDDLSELFIIEDVNFDGYQDIRLYTGIPAYNNLNFTYWLFDPQTEHFVSSEAFNAANLVLPTFAAKEIISKWVGGAGFYGTHYHKVINGQPIWILQESSDEAMGIRTQTYMGDETMEIVHQDVRLCVEEDPSSSYASEDIIYCSKKVKKPVKKRIITAYLVNVRSAPTRSAKVIKQVPIGTVLKEVARSEAQEKIGQSQDYWYQVKTEDSGETGWVFGSLSMPFESEQNYLQIAQAQIQKKLNLRDKMALTDFLARIKNEIELPLENAAELGLLHLSSLQKSINPTDKDKASYRAWFEKQKDFVYYDVHKEKWFVKSEAFWKLHEKYYPLPITERIAWAGTKNFFAEKHLNGCWYFFCQIQRVYNTTVQYLKFHPNGEHKGEALEELAHFLSSYLKKYEEKGNVVITIKGVDLLRLLAIIRATVEQTSHPKQTEVLRLLDRLKKPALQTSK